MTHPILSLQASLVAALRTADIAVFDAPPAGQAPPYVVIARHDVLPRDGDTAPGYEHRLLLHVWAAEASRKAAGQSGPVDTAPFGKEVNRRCLELLIGYAVQQRQIPQPLSVDDLW